MSGRRRVTVATGPQEKIGAGMQLMRQDDELLRYLEAATVEARTDLGDTGDTSLPAQKGEIQEVQDNRRGDALDHEEEPDFPSTGHRSGNVREDTRLAGGSLSLLRTLGRAGIKPVTLD